MIKKPKPAPKPTPKAQVLSWWDSTIAGSLDTFGSTTRMLVEYALAHGKTIYTGTCLGILEDEGEEGAFQNLLKDLSTQTGGHVYFTSAPIFGRGESEIWFLFPQGSVLVKYRTDLRVAVTVSTMDESLYESIGETLGTHLLPENVRQPIYALARGPNGIEISDVGTAGEPFEPENYMPEIEEDFKFVVAELQRELPIGRLILISGKPGTGKCVARGTLIMDPDSGLLLPVEQAIGQRTRVLTFSKEEGFQATTPSMWLKTGVKQCLCLGTKAGHTLEATPEHPFLTPDGWKRLDEIIPGMFVAAASSAPFPTQVKPLPDNHLVLLAALLAEGNYSQKVVNFSNGDQEILRAVEEALECVEGYLKQYSPDKPCDWRVISKKMGRVSKIRMLLDKYGLGHRKAPEKSLPDEIFQLGPEQLAKFLGILWSCDGSIANRGEITLGLSSKVLVQQVQHLLLRLGICSTMRSRTIHKRGRQFHSWEIRITGTTRQRFAKTIPLIGEKLKKLESLEFFENPNEDLVPLTPELSLLLKQASETYQQGGGNLQKVGNLLGWTSGFSESTLLRRESISKRVLRAFIDATGDTSLDWYLRIRWEEVISNEMVGEREVYDFTIPGTSNFLANDLVAHNTYFIRGVIHDVLDAIFVLVPAHLVNELAGPELVPMLVRARGMAGSTKPIVLILEDADRALVPREEGSLAAISALLNVSDGILGHALNLRIVCTTNAEYGAIDEALKRPGRLSKQIQIGLLSPERAGEVYTRISDGVEGQFDGPIPLAEVYRFFNCDQAEEEEGDTDEDEDVEDEDDEEDGNYDDMDDDEDEEE